MEVLVRKPPVFTIEPEAMYQRKVSESVEMHCDAQEAEGTQKPTIQWQRRDGKILKMIFSTRTRKVCIMNKNSMHSKVRFTKIKLTQN